MANWKDALPSQWLKASDFDRPRLMTIKRFTVDKVGDDQRPIVYFNEDEKGLALNITNGNTIEEIAGTSDPDRWTNVRVVLYKTRTDYQGKRVDCIRIRKPKPGAAPPPPPEPEEFQPTDDDVPF